MPAKSSAKLEDLYKLHDATLLQEPYSTIRGDHVVVKFRDKPPKRWDKIVGSSKHSYNQGSLKKSVTAVILKRYSNVSC